MLLQCSFCLVEQDGNLDAVWDVDCVLSFMSVDFKLPRCKGFFEAMFIKGWLEQLGEVTDAPGANWDGETSM